MTEINQKTILKLKKSSIPVSPYINNGTPVMPRVHFRWIPKSEPAFIFGHAQSHSSVTYILPCLLTDGGIIQLWISQRKQTGESTAFRSYTGGIIDIHIH